MSLKDLLPSQWKGKPIVEGVVDAFDTSATRLSDAVAQRVLESQIDTASAEQIEEFRQMLGAPRVDFRSYSRAALFPSAILQLLYANQSAMRISGAALTVQARIRIDSLPVSTAGILSKWNPSLSTEQSFSFDLLVDSGTTYLRMRVTDGSNTTERRFALDSSYVGTWITVGGRFDGAQSGDPRMVLFVDGASVAATSTSSAAATLQDASRSFYVGSLDGGGQFPGAIDMAIVWATARTDQQIAEVGDPAEGSGAGYWTFTPTQLVKTADLSGNGQDLSIVGDLDLTDGPQATLTWARRLILAFAAAARCPGSIEAMYRAWGHAVGALALDAFVDTPFVAGEITWNHDPVPREGDVHVDQAHEDALLAAVQAAAPQGAVVTPVEI